MNFPSFLRTPLRCLAAALLWGLFGLSASARQTDVLRRVLLSHWGIAPHNFSGIAPLGNDRYAVVSDKDTAAGFYVWHIEQDSVTGQVVRVTDEGFRPHAVSAGAPQPDYEGVAYEPAQARVWIADEATQQIRAFARSGLPTGDSLCIPAAESAVAIRPNRGFEALTFSPTDSLLWTAPEEPPRADPPSVGAAGSPSPATGGVIELLGFSPSGALQRRVPYAIDPSAPSGMVRAHLNGVPALCALPDGSLLVLERELLIPRRYLGSWCAVRLFRVSAQDLAAAETSTRTPVRKQLLTRWITRLRCFRFDLANYEGLCLGRRLRDGRQTLLCVSDAQGGAGRWFLRMRDALRVIVLPSAADEAGAR